MPVHFGPKVIGEKAYEKTLKVAQEGSEYFGSRVIGGDREVGLPHQGGAAHGEKVVGQAEAELQQAALMAGGVKRLDDLKIGHLRRLCKQGNIKYQRRDGRDVLVERIKKHYGVDNGD